MKGATITFNYSEELKKKVRYLLKKHGSYERIREHCVYENGVWRYIND